MPAIVIRVDAQTGLSTDLVSRLARNLPTEPGEAADLFWMFLRTDAEGETIDLLGLFSDGRDHPVDADVILETIAAAAGPGLIDGPPRMIRSR